MYTIQIFYYQEGEIDTHSTLHPVFLRVSRWGYFVYALAYYMEVIYMNKTGFLTRTMTLITPVIILLSSGGWNSCIAHCAETHERLFVDVFSAGSIDRSSEAHIIRTRFVDITLALLSSGEVS